MATLTMRPFEEITAEKIVDQLSAKFSNNASEPKLCDTCSVNFNCLEMCAAYKSELIKEFASIIKTQKSLRN